MALTFGLVYHRISVSVGSQARKSGDSACFFTHFLLDRHSLPLAPTSWSFPHLTCLCHERDEGFVVCLVGGGNPVRGWPH